MQSINLCLFECPSLTHETLDLFASTFDYGTWKNQGNVLDVVLKCWVLKSVLYRSK